MPQKMRNAAAMKGKQPGMLSKLQMMQWYGRSIARKLREKMHRQEHIIPLRESFKNGGGKKNLHCCSDLWQNQAMRFILRNIEGRGICTGMLFANLQDNEMVTTSKFV